MSKSLKRVIRALADAGVNSTPLEIGDATTAQQAADQVGCALGQIVKSIVFQGQESGEAILFLTAGDNQVSADKAGTVAREPLGKADAALIRARTGFAIGGVSPIGHLTPPRAYFDPDLLAHGTVWSAAGTPRHVFPCAPQVLLQISGAQQAEFTS